MQMVQNSEGTKALWGKESLSVHTHPYPLRVAARFFAKSLGVLAEMLCFYKYIFVCIRRGNSPSPSHGNMIEALTVLHLFLIENIY